MDVDGHIKVAHFVTTNVPFSVNCFRIFLVCAFFKLFENDRMAVLYTRIDIDMHTGERERKRGACVCVCAGWAGVVGGGTRTECLFVRHKYVLTPVPNSIYIFKHYILPLKHDVYKVMCRGQWNCFVVFKSYQLEKQTRSWACKLHCLRVWLYKTGFICRRVWFRDTQATAMKNWRVPWSL